MEEPVDEVEELLRRIGSVAVPSGMRERLVCSCFSRLVSASGRKRRNAVTVVSALAVVNLAIGLVALRAHRQHLLLTKSLDGD